MVYKKKVLTIFQKEGKQKLGKNKKVGGMIKRLVDIVSKEMRKGKGFTEIKLLKKKSSKRIIDEDQGETDSMLLYHMPEILRVSPMNTSCEVALISSSDDGLEQTSENTTSNLDDEAKVDGSYHIVLNLHRSPCSCDEDNEKNEIDSVDVTQDMTDNDISRGMSDTYSQLEEIIGHNHGIPMVADTDYDYPATKDHDGYHCHYHRARHDLASYRKSLAFESLFNPSDSDDDDEFDVLFLDGNYESPVNLEEDQNYDFYITKPDSTDELNKLLNTTLETVAEEDEEAYPPRHDGVPSEILVRVLSL